MRRFGLLVKTYGTHASPGIIYITGSSPAITANLAGPVPAIAHSVLAKTEHNIAAHLIQRSPHYLVWLFIIIQRWIFGRDIPIRTPVVFQVINAPVSISLRILVFMLIAAQIAAASLWAGR